METKAGNLEGLAESSSRILESEATSKESKSKDESKVEEEDVPDPDEDDLDDLDGISLYRGYYVIRSNISYRYAG